MFGSVQEDALSLLSWENLRDVVCGEADCPVEVFRENVETYVNEEQLAMFYSMLESFTAKEVRCVALLVNHFNADS